MTNNTRQALQSKGHPKLNLHEEFLDFPSAWEIQNKLKLNHDPKCSSVPGHHPLSGPGLLCDCGEVKNRYELLMSARHSLSIKEG